MILTEPCKFRKEVNKRPRDAKRILGIKPGSGQYALHHCDQPLCIEPTHLYIGTQQDNVNDMMSRGRHGYGDNYGSAHPSSKLTGDQVREIKRRIAQGESQSSVAKDYPVGRSQIANIISCGSWKREIL